MTSNEILKADVLDILFDNRNKQYGAYVLRKNYSTRLGTALLMAMAMVLLLLFFARPGAVPLATAVEKPDLVLHRVELPPPPPTPPAPPEQRVTPPKPIAQNSYVNIKMVEEPDPAKKMKDLAEIEAAAIGTTHVEGTVDPLIQVAPQQAEASGAGAASVAEEKETSFVPLERQPEFPGGPAAWANFLNKYLRTPGDLEAGEKKMVLISFMVDAEGSVTGFKVVQSGGTAFDNEVIRVLKKMPRWKPAIQNSHPVSVVFTQPVTFVGLEE